MFYFLFSSRNPHLLARQWRYLPSLSRRRISIPSLVDSIRDLAINGQISQAFISYSSLRQLSPPPHSFLHPISSLLAASTKARAFSLGLQLHAHLLSLGCHGNSFLLPRLVAFYSACGNLEEAQVLAEESSAKDCFLWNILLSAYVSYGFPWRSLQIHSVMAKKGIFVDGFACSSILKACCKTLNLSHARILHSVMHKTGVLALDIFLYNSLVSVYAKCGRIADAEKMFDEMPQRDVVSWNAMICGYVSTGLWDNSRQLLENMRREISVNTVTWNTIICGNQRMGNYAESLQLISQMKKIGCSLDDVTIIVSLSACSKLRCLKLGKEIHALVVRAFLEDQEHVTNSLITMYSKCDEIRIAEILFERCRFKSSVTWNCIITAYAHADMHKDAFFLFRTMLERIGQPTDVAILTVLSLCGRLGDYCHGREFHGYIVKMATFSSLSLSNALVFMYCRSGFVSEAWKVFLSMEEKDRFSYTSMIGGFGGEGEGVKALTLFRAMTRQGLTPDHVAMKAVLSACCRARLLTEAQWIFDNRTQLSGIVQKPGYCSSMGRVEEFLYCSAAQQVAVSCAL